MAARPVARICEGLAEAPADDRGRQSNTYEELAEVINCERRGRCGLGHLHRPTPVEIPENFAEFDDEAFANHSIANHSIKMEDGRFASNVIDNVRRRKRSQSPPAKSHLENSAFAPEKRKRRLHSPPAHLPSTRKETRMSLFYIRDQHKAAKTNQIPSPIAVIDQLPPPKKHLDNSAFGPEKEQARMSSPSTRRLDRNRSQVAHRYRSRDPQNSAVGASNKIRQFRSPSPSRSLDISSRDVNSLRSMPPRRGSEYSNFGSSKNQNRTQSLSLSQSLKNPASGVFSRLQSHGLERSVVSAGKQRHISRSPSPTRTLQNSASHDRNHLQSLPQIQGSDYSSFGAGMQQPRIRPSRAVNQLPSHISESSSLDPKPERKESEARLPIVDVESSTCVSAEKRSQLYESSPRYQISGAFPLSPPFPEHPNSSDSSSDAPSPTRTFQNSASHDRNRLQPLPQIKSSDYSSFGAGMQEPRIRPSRVVNQLPSHILESSSLDPKPERKESEARLPIVDVENSTCVSAEKRSQLYESSPRYQISGAFPLSPPCPEHPNSSDSKIPRPQSPPPSESLETVTDQQMQLSKSLLPTHGMTNHASVEPASLRSATQNKSPPPKDSSPVGNVDKFDSDEKKATPSISNCQCRLSATRSILASGLDPLEHLLKQNMCNEQRYKETALIFLRMFDEVKLVQGCGEHVHNCSNSVV
ncbi:uncharacterized protein MELLADRAFT_69689 [Melampsora larici-populina 98AG31]|uniref:Uncharacterized protein n=1 Tax=Melampsora larici-populina (strain 98AG31 / pathotype 3-4-7) TaxID=747676 RepID=F4SBR8_MELLP|nr:uncharacterized protein MELLADRAFT_69689 [Melampsora larici-populina 98AG31]EGF97913.1 hypothetical protein MELLADRAFT_69689 [Melampsora larici-populina 98AG31]